MNSNTEQLTEVIPDSQANDIKPVACAIALGVRIFKDLIGGPIGRNNMDDEYIAEAMSIALNSYLN